MPVMRTTFVMDPPPIVEDWLARRRALGQDRLDEVWEGEYHVAPEASNRHALIQVQLIEHLDELGLQVSVLARRCGCHVVLALPDLVVEVLAQGATAVEPVLDDRWRVGHEQRSHGGDGSARSLCVPYRRTR